MLLNHFPQLSEQFSTALAENRLHHAWLLQGERGIGKRLLAEELALQLFGNTNQSKRLIAQSAHPDYQVIDAEDTTKTGVLPVDVIRNITPFLRDTKVMTDYKVLIIDALDDLNHNAANAALKLVEEPTQNTVLFLLNHASGQIPATLRSRCRTVNLAVPTFSTEQFAALISYYSDTLPTPFILKIANNHLSTALKLLNQEEKKLAALETLTSSNTNLNAQQDAAVSLKDNIILQRLATEHLLNKLQNHCKTIALQQNPERVLQLYLDLQQRFQDASALNLDWAQVYILAVLESRKYLQ